MQVRIKFDADIIITGCDMKEVRRKFEGMKLFSDEALECNAEFIEETVIDDAETYEDLWNDYFCS